MVSSVAHLCKLLLATHSAGKWPLVGVSSEMVKILPLILNDDVACLLLVGVVALEKANFLFLCVFVLEHEHLKLVALRGGLVFEDLFVHPVKLLSVCLCE